MSFLKKPRRRPAPQASDEEVEDERLKKLKQREAAQGRKSTILTGPQGVGASSASSTGTASALTG